MVYAIASEDMTRMTPELFMILQVERERERELSCVSTEDLMLEIIGILCSPGFYLVQQYRSID